MWWKVLPDGRDVHTLTVQKDTGCHCSPVETPTLVVAAGVPVKQSKFEAYLWPDLGTLPLGVQIYPLELAAILQIPREDQTEQS